MWYSRRFTCRLKVTRRVPLVEQELNAPVFSGVRLVHFVQLHVSTFLALHCDVRYNFRVKRSSVLLTYICLVRVRDISFMLFVIIYLSWCPNTISILTKTRDVLSRITITPRMSLVEQELFILSDHLSSPPDTKDVTSGTGTTYPFRSLEFTPGHQGCH